MPFFSWPILLFCSVTFTYPAKLFFLRRFTCLLFSFQRTLDLYLTWWDSFNQPVNPGWFSLSKLNRVDDEWSTRVLELGSSYSLERRWSSRTFRYGYLVTTSPQSPTPPSTALSFRLSHRLRVLSAFVVWRAVCTRPGNVFTAVCWPAITSDSDFM